MAFKFSHFWWLQVSTELDGAQRQLVKKEKEINRLDESLKSLKVDLDTKSVRIKELEADLDGVQYQSKLVGSACCCLPGIAAVFF